MTLGQIAPKSDRLQIETILHILWKFQFDRPCFQTGEARSNFGVGNNIVSICVSNADTAQLQIAIILR